MWRYHTIHTIQRYGSLNGLTTETYETLHKNWVKNPYRMSNKKDTHNQMLKTVYCNYLSKFFKVLSIYLSFLILDSTTNNYKFYQKKYKSEIKLYEVITLGIAN